MTPAEIAHAEAMLAAIANSVEGAYSIGTVNMARHALNLRDEVARLDRLAKAERAYRVAVVRRMHPIANGLWPQEADEQCDAAKGALIAAGGTP